MVERCSLSSTHYPRALSLDPALDFKIGTCRLATSRYLPSLAHQVIVLKMHPCGALLFEGPLALRMPRDKKEAVRSEGNVKGVVTLNSSVEEQLSVEFVIKDYMDILSTNQCGSEIARWAPQSWGTDKKSARRESV